MSESEIEKIKKKILERVPEPKMRAYLRILELKDPVRKTLLALLDLGGEANAYNISLKTGITRPNVSSRLALLETLGYVEKNREGRRVYYRLKLEKFNQEDLK
jgi:DNA-binding transcriptional ArsR family regulator